MDLCELIRGVSYKRGEAHTDARPGLLPLLRANNIDGELVFRDLQYIPQERVSSSQRLRVGDIVLAMSSGSKAVVGKAATLRCPWDGTFGAFCAVLRPRPGIDPLYFGYYFQTRAYRDVISDASAGVNINNLKREHFESLRLPIPPLAEQRRIVARVESLLERVNAARDRLARVPAIHKRFRQSVLAAACSGRLTEGLRALQHHQVEDAAALCCRVTAERAARRSSSVRRQGDLKRQLVRDDLEFFALPCSWKWTDLQFLMDPREPFCYGVVQPGDDDVNGVSLVRAGDLERGTVATSSLRRIPAAVDASYSRSRLRGGELLVTVVGANIGTSAVAPHDCRGFNIARAVAKIPVREFSAEYVLLWLNTQRAIGWMKRDAREVARPTLNLEQLKTLPVPLPPIDEQHEIVCRATALLARFEVIEQRFAGVAKQLGKLTQAILAKAFRGELVPTEAELARREGRDYEPASVLLERIRAERAAATNKVPQPRARRHNQTPRTP